MSNRVRIQALLVTPAICLASAVASSAEFLQRDIQPTVASIALTEQAVAVAIDGNFFEPDASESKRFFQAQRSDYRFARIDEQQYLALMQSDHRFRETRPGRDGVDTRPAWLLAAPLCPADADPAAGRTVELGDGQSSVEVDLKCGSWVSDAAFIDTTVWIATYQSTDYFDFSAEGLVLASRFDGRIRSRIDIGAAAARVVLPDPWSRDVWVLTDRRLAVLTRDAVIKTWREPVHGFDEVAGRPDVLLPGEPTATDPLAIVAYTLGPKHYRQFYDAVRSVPSAPDPELVSRLFDRSWNHDPQLPQTFEDLLDHAEVTNAWRKFACLLEGARAKELCATPVTEWRLNSASVAACCCMSLLSSFACS